MNGNFLGWLSIVRLGLVQTALGAIVVLTTSTLNRVMVVEMAMPAMVPGALVALHYGVQMLRPRLGYGSDVGGRRTPWIIGGMAVLALGGVGGAVATVLMGINPAVGIALAVAAFTLIGLGVGAAGTSLLVLLAKRVQPERRAAAATVAWIMMILGFVVTASVAGALLDPFSPVRLVGVTMAVAMIALVVTLLAVVGIEGRHAPLAHRVGTLKAAAAGEPSFRSALSQVWSEPRARRFTLFVFVSMLAYSAQDLILEPFAGSVFGFSPGQSTRLSGVQHAGVLIGMLSVAVAGSGFVRGRFGAMSSWTIGGCIASSIAFISLTMAAHVGPAWPLRISVFGLGFANGVFAVAAIASMMALAGAGREAREGVRMGLWGAAQAVAFGLGGFTGTAVVDAARMLLGNAATAYAIVFAGEAVLFVAAGILAARVGRPADARQRTAISAVGASYLVGEG